jgi:hypothetical protein
MEKMNGEFQVLLDKKLRHLHVYQTSKNAAGTGDKSGGVA